MDRLENSLTVQISKLDDKVFRHLTNDDIHAVRSTMVDKNTFDLINQLRAAQIAEIKAEICDVKTLVIESRQEARNAKTK